MEFLPPVIDGLKNMLAAFQNLSPEVKRFMVMGAGIAAALGPLLIILPSLIQGFMALLSPIGLVIAAVVGLGIAIVTFADEIAPYITDVINYFITLYNESSLLRGIIGGIKGTVQVVFDFFLFAVDAVIGAFQDLGAIISAVLSGDLSNIGDAISDAFTNAADRMAEFGTKAAEDFTSAVNTELEREPLELVTKESVANALSTLGGLTNLIPSAISGGGADGAVTPTPTETVTVQADLEFEDIEFIDHADLDEEDIDKVIERTNLVKNQINSIAQSMANFIDSTFRSIIDGTATFEEVMRNMIKQMLIQLASLIAQFAILSVLMPSSSLVKGGLGKFIGGGFGIPQFAGGGIVSGPVIAQVGEYSGAQHNPEVIAPLDKLQSMMGGQSVQVTGKISGRDILLTSERNAIDRNRVRGF